MSGLADRVHSTGGAFTVTSPAGGPTEIKVEYSADKTGIAKLYATGKVLLVNAKDAAQADQAVYTIATGEVVMTGNVLLTQGQAAMSAENLVIDLTSGTGRLEGRVTTTFTPGKN